MKKHNLNRNTCSPTKCYNIDGYIEYFIYRVHSVHFSVRSYKHFDV